MKMDAEIAAQFNVLNDVRRNPTIAWRKSNNRQIELGIRYTSFEILASCLSSILEPSENGN